MAFLLTCHTFLIPKLKLSRVHSNHQPAIKPVVFVLMYHFSAEPSPSPMMFYLLYGISCWALNGSSGCGSLAERWDALAGKFNYQRLMAAVEKKHHRGCSTYSWHHNQKILYLPWGVLNKPLVIFPTYTPINHIIIVVVILLPKTKCCYVAIVK